MKTLFLTIVLSAFCNIINAQVNTNSTSTPNSGSDYRTPVPNNTPLPNTLSTPHNSTVPGANGSYSGPPTNPDMTRPNGNNTFTTTTPPSVPQAPKTVSPQTNK